MVKCAQSPDQTTPTPSESNRLKVNMGCAGDCPPKSISNATLVRCFSTLKVQAGSFRCCFEPLGRNWKDCQPLPHESLKCLFCSSSPLILLGRSWQSLWRVPQLQPTPLASLTLAKPQLCETGIHPVDGHKKGGDCHAIRECSESSIANLAGRKQSDHFLAVVAAPLSCPAKEDLLPLCPVGLQVPCPATSLLCQLADASHQVNHAWVAALAGLRHTNVAGQRQATLQLHHHPWRCEKKLRCAKDCACHSRHTPNAAPMAQTGSVSQKTWATALSWTNLSCS